MAQQFSTMDEYVASLTPEAQAVFVELRRRIKAAVPDSSETISYQIATFDLDGEHLLHVAGWKGHIGAYPIPALDEAMASEVDGYRSGKSTMRFPLDRPIPYDLIVRIVLTRAGQLTAKR